MYQYHTSQPLNINLLAPIDWLAEYKEIFQWLAAVVFVAAVGVMAFKLEANSAESQQLANTITMSKQAVRNNLDCPKTASFPWLLDGYLVKKESDRMYVSSYVDAENGFGATKRAYWTVELTGNGGQVLNVRIFE